MRKSVQNKVHYEGLQHIYLEFLKLSCNVPHLHDVLTHTPNACDTNGR